GLNPCHAWKDSKRARRILPPQPAGPLQGMLKRTAVKFEGFTGDSTAPNSSWRPPPSARLRLRVGPPATDASAPALGLPSPLTQALGPDFPPLALSQQPSPPRA